MEVNYIEPFLFQIKIIFNCIFAFIFTAIITWLVRLYALHKVILDIPNERSSHQEPTPRGGGIAIVLTFTLSVLWLGWQNLIASNLVWALTGGGLAVAAIGYCDDINSLKVRWRILIQFLIAFWTLFWLEGFTVLDLGTWKIALHWEGTILATLGIVWCINLYNFMDGIDGLAGSEGIFVGLCSGIALWWFGNPYLALTLWLLTATIAGFTIWNWQPAKIFLGDVGSGYLGYIFAVLAIYTANNEFLPISFWSIVLAVFLCDATFTLVQRVYQGKSWYTPHREFAFHILVLNGASHKQVTMSILAINCCILLPTAFASLYWPAQSFWLLASALISLWLTWFWIRGSSTDMSVYNVRQLNEDG